MKAYIIYIVIAGCILLAGCNRNRPEAAHAHDHSQPHSHGHDHEHDHSKPHEAEPAAEEHSPDEIIFSREQAEAAGLQIETAQAGTFAAVIKTGGQILASQADETTVVATANGVVSFAQSSLAEGMYLRRGQPLLLISSANLPEGNPAVRAKLAFESAQKDMARADTLLRDRLITAGEHEQVRLRYETARAAHLAQADNITDRGLSLNAPQDGFILSLRIKPGEYVGVGQPVATIARNRRFRLRTEVSDSHFSELKNIRSANFRTSYSPEIYRLADLKGRLLSAGKSASDGRSAFIPVTFEFEPEGDMLAGAFAEVYLLLARQENALTVPLSAITEDQGMFFVYLQVDDEGYVRREIAVGPDDGLRAVVLSGLSPGDRLVAKGAYRLKLAAASAIIPEGHTHSH
ncbi:MAG: efflux RND transporter periplasmic adaptor subunit [Tannerellaceae bacterium]|jgi:RND family efflux transporter MFP subunit|nr:efflux RND transporter periplasmic adaptor subunit [Tannerellaceae bacterium]